MGKAKQPAQPAHGIDQSQVQRLVQALLQYGPGLISVLQRLVDVFQSKQGTPPPGAGASPTGDLVGQIIDQQVAGLANLVYLRQYLDAQTEDGGGTTGDTGGAGGTAGTGQPTQPGATVGVPTVGQQPKKP